MQKSSFVKLSSVLVSLILLSGCGSQMDAEFSADSFSKSMVDTKTSIMKH